MAEIVDSIVADLKVADRDWLVTIIREIVRKELDRRAADKHLRR